MRQSISQKAPIVLFGLIASTILSFSLFSIEPAYAGGPPGDYACRGCHGNNQGQLTLPSGETLSLLAPLEDLNNSPHNLDPKMPVLCLDCHRGKIHYQYPHQPTSARNRPDGSTPFLPLEEPFEPESHIDSNWASGHRFEFDSTCQGCHDVSNPGGSDDSSYCANSGCHGIEWKFAGLNAPGIIELTNVLDESLPVYPEVDLTWTELVGPLLEARCVACHGGTAGLYLDSYEGVLAGGNLGPAIVPGKAEESLLVELQRSDHPNSLAPRELEWIVQWIDAGAPK